MEIIRKTFFDGYASADIGMKAVFMALLVALAISLYIYAVYRGITSKTFYSKNFNLSLIGVCLITTAIIATIQSSVVVSLGMVGALSIVRFRTAIKNPMDLMFLFWSISVGIICGAGHAIFAVELSLVLTLAILVLEWVPVGKAPMILVVNCDDIDAERKVTEHVKQYAKHFTVKSRNMTMTTLDLTIEVRTNRASDLIRKLIEIPGIRSANLLQHDGEVTF
ncbi:MAG: DUF4956 domain-containing protein [Clostridia bacterium]|nr:DUF4956 domain-containing protein [Clostridia bacterium]